MDPRGDGDGQVCERVWPMAHLRVRPFSVVAPRGKLLRAEGGI